MDDEPVVIAPTEPEYIKAREWLYIVVMDSELKYTPQLDPRSIIALRSMLKSGLDNLDGEEANRAAKLPASGYPK